MDSDGEDDRPKRPRTAQEEIVQQALDEDDAMRRARKAQKEGVLPKQKTGKTLQEIEVRSRSRSYLCHATHSRAVVISAEVYLHAWNDSSSGFVFIILIPCLLPCDAHVWLFAPHVRYCLPFKDEEGGPVKESLLGIAQAKRAAKRKKVEDVDDTDIPDDVDQFAEKLEVEEEGGIKFMPFSLTGKAPPLPLWRFSIPSWIIAILLSLEMSLPWKAFFLSLRHIKTCSTCIPPQMSGRLDILMPRATLLKTKWVLVPDLIWFV